MDKHKFYPKERDDKVLQYLEAMTYATADQLSRLSPRAVSRDYSYRNMNNNLRRFKNQLGYIDTIFGVRRGFPYIYFITKKGKEYLDSTYGKVHKSQIWNASSWKHDLYLNEFLVEVLLRHDLDGLLFDRYTNSMSFDKYYRKSGGDSIAPDIFLEFRGAKRFFVEIDCRRDEKDFERKAKIYDKYPKKYWHLAYRRFMKEREIEQSFKPRKPDVLFIIYPPDEMSQIAYTSPTKPLELPEKTKRMELVRTRNALKHLKKLNLRKNYVIPGHWLKEDKGFLDPNDWKEEYDKLDAEKALSLMPTYQVFS